MRKQFIECKTRRRAIQECPWASYILKVDGGYQCFESIDDYNIFINQQ